ncbi:MAG: YqgE/AlgH family protein [Myxococcota bacterium]|nr:YqgE/AlgH family protein [Myxococcota bacterium]
MAAPHLKDPNFERTVILLCEFDAKGAFGVIINRPSPIRVRHILSALDMRISTNEDSLCGWGGPVQNELCLIIHGAPPTVHDTWNICDGISIGGNKAILQHCEQNGSPFRVVLGYAGWGPEQLVSEIERGDWLYSEVTPELVFDTPTSAIYDVALSDFGLTSNCYFGDPIDN